MVSKSDLKTVVHTLRDFFFDKEPNKGRFAAAWLKPEIFGGLYVNSGVFELHLQLADKPESKFQEILKIGSLMHDELPIEVRANLFGMKLHLPDEHGYRQSGDIIIYDPEPAEGYLRRA